MRNFTISSDIAAALVEVPPGHMREIHWHPISDEWQYYIAGQARMTVFGAQSQRAHLRLSGRPRRLRAEIACRIMSRTPEANTLRFLELFKSGRYMDVSLKQWMANTPHELVEAHLNVDRDLVDSLSKDKEPIA